MQDRPEITAALKNSETCATLLNAILNRQYGDEWVNWDPLTVYLEIKSDYRVDPPSELLDKIGAIQVLRTSDSFFNRIDAFLAICNTLSTGDPAFSAFNPVDIPGIAWGVSEVALIRDMRPFVHAIRQYLLQLLGQGGYTEINYPETIKMVFDTSPTSKEVKQAMMAGDLNKDSVEQFVDEQLTELIQQFNAIPGMSSMDDYIFKGVSGIEV